MANEYAPAKSKISLAPVKALTKPLIEITDMPRASAIHAPAIKSMAATTSAKSPQASKSPAIAKPALAKLEVAKPGATEPVLPTNAVQPVKAEAAIAYLAKTKIITKHEKLDVKAPLSKAQPVESATPSVKAKPVAPVLVNASVATAPLGMLNTIRSLQERTGVLAQTLIAASQADLSQMLAPADPAAMLRLHVAAITRTQATFKAYWTDVFSVVQHRG
jgi:hypothetical protein